MGRPTSLTPEVHQQIVSIVAEGNYLSDAAECAGVTYTTVKRWMQRGATGEEPYCAFRAAVKTARAEARRKCVTSILSETAWQARAWYLERTDPDHWGRRDRVHQTVDDRRAPKQAPDEAVEAEVLKHIGERYGVDLNAALEEAKRANHN